MTACGLFLCLTLAGQPAPAAKTPAGASDAPASLQAAASLLERLELKELVTATPLVVWWVLGLAVVVAVFLGRVLAIVLARLARRFRQRGWTALAHVLDSASGPLNLALLTFGLTFGLAGVRMSPTLFDVWRRGSVLLYSLAVFWCLYNLAGLVEIGLRRLNGHRQSLLDKQLGPLVRRTLRTLLVILAALFVVEGVFNQDVGAWIAGLGIAGLALSLAAQDSLKNLFGSITILLDRPFQVGDRIVFTGFDGTIEDIGLRSTKIRTAGGHVVTIPNSKIVSEAVENVSRRPYIRRSFSVALPAAAPPATLAEAVRILRGVLEEEGICEPIHPVLAGEAFPPRVYLAEMTDERALVAVNYWFAPPHYWEYAAHAQKVNLRMFERLEQAGIRSTIPPPPAAPPPPTRAADEG